MVNHYTDIDPGEQDLPQSSPNILAMKLVRRLCSQSLECCSMRTNDGMAA